jgi:uncharacterized protein
MATILITGGTGVIGSTLCDYLVEQHHEVIVLTRTARAGRQGITYATWDPAKQVIDTAAVQQADYIINLAGAGVADKRWSEKRKKEIVDSRVQSGELLARIIKEVPNKIKAVVSISGSGYYGDDKDRKSDRPFVEDDEPGTDFLAATCVQWEEAIKPVTRLGKRLVILRCHLVFSNQGGAFAEFRKPVQWGLATIIGSGNQVISWIHVHDLARLLLTSLENESMNGVYNAVGPNPVSNKDLMIALAKKLKGKFYTTFHVPAALLKIMFGELSVEVLKSATVSNKKVSQTGFQFTYPTLDAALQDLTRK